MANISVTLNCNRHCGYCFARSLRDAREGPVEMSRGTFLEALNFIQRSGIKQVRLLGGEPTLHVDFPWMIQRIKESGHFLCIFTNGLIPDSLIRTLDDFPPGRMTVIANINSPSQDDRTEFKKQFRVLDRFHSRVMLGINMDKALIDLDFLLDLVMTHTLNKAIRLGLALPDMHGENHYLAPRHYMLAGQTISEFAKKAAKEGVRLEFDCGFVPCMFPAEFFKENRDFAGQIGICCGPVPDLLPWGEFIHCYPLAPYAALPLDGRISAAECIRVLRARLKKYRVMGIFKECFECETRLEGHCTGGCLSLAMQRMQAGPFSVKVPFDDQSQ